MEVQAKVKNQRISAQKVRLIADEIRGNNVSRALDKLTFSTKKSAALVKKVLESAISNAENNASNLITFRKMLTTFIEV